MPAIANALGFPVEVVMQIAGYLPAVGDVDPDSPVGRMVAVGQKVDWSRSSSREGIIISILEQWIAEDRETNERAG